jgi:hypothetical protein
MLIRVLRNIAIFMAFDIIRSLIMAHSIGPVSLAMSVFAGLAGLLRPAELVLLVLLSQQFSTRGHGSAGFKIQFAAILLIALGYLFTFDSLVAKLAWIATIAWMTFDWWTIPVARSEAEMDTKAS